LLPDFAIQKYAISPDGQRITFVATDETGHSPLWIAPLNGRSAPRQIAALDTWAAYFVGGGYIILAGEEKGGRFVYRVKEDGTDLQKLQHIDSAAGLFGASPDGRFIILPGSTDQATWPSLAYPVGGGSPTVLCEECTGSTDIENPRPQAVSWSPDGKFLYLFLQGSMFAIPLQPGQMLPPIPAGGFRSKQDLAGIPGARLLPEPGAFPGPDPSIYTFTRVSTHRNIYRVPVP
jgi:Tol biopolymer transport system component